MSDISLVVNYLKFWFSAKRKKGHGVHSPYIFDLITEVFYKKKKNQKFKAIETIRKTLKKSIERIEINDLGRGSRKATSIDRNVAHIAKNSLKPKKQAQLLYRLLAYKEASKIIELGTSLGITTAYLAQSNLKAHVFTLEGCTNTLNIAKTNHAKLNLQNISYVQGNFNNTLSAVLKNEPFWDVIFFDGNHTKDATINYFLECLPYTNNESIFIFDDIYLSEEMHDAWQTIINNEQVKASIDIFHMGFVFFRKEMTKEHFKLRF